MVAMKSYAMDANRSRGRRYPEHPHPYRNDYARDRDRVIHSRAFRRLEAKTQVFTTPFSDHFRNRLTHTLEVSQIARTVSEALGLNTDITEALALVHDIGHPPFGHAGEGQLDLRMREHGERFDHNLHALRIVEQFEQRYIDFPGLNLTFEVREVIIKPSRDYYDSFEARILDFDQLCEEVPAFREVFTGVEREYPERPRKLTFNEALKRILDHLVTDLIENTRRQVEESGVRSVEDVRYQGKRLVGFSPEIAGQDASLRKFLHSRVYSHPVISAERERLVASLDKLFSLFLDHPDRMPKHHAALAEIEPRHRVVCDYIAGMTDHFLLRQCRELLGESVNRSS
jgi:dGTPase